MRVLAFPLKRLCSVAIAAATLCVGCSDHERPPPPVEVSEPGKNDADDPTTSPDEDLLDQDDDLAAEPCGVSVELSVLRPNFYFVLDASESMQDIMPMSGGITRHLAARRAVLDMLRKVGHRVNFAAALFPAPDSSDGCAPGNEVFPLSPGEPLLADGGDNALLESLTFTLRKHSPSGATPTSATLSALKPRLLELESATAIFLLTDGAPNCDLAETCGTETCIPNIEKVEFEGFAKCDASFNCCAPELLPHLCLDENDTVVELRDLADLGIKTYVIGIPGSETYAHVLNAMATAAGTHRDDTNVGYYPVEDAEELANTLTDLGQQLSASCEFDLGKPPERPSRVRVLADGTQLEEDAEDGWAWSGEASIEIRGDACAAWRSADFTRLSVFEDCTVKAR